MSPFEAAEAQEQLESRHSNSDSDKSSESAGEPSVGGDCPHQIHTAGHLYQLISQLHAFTATIVYKHSPFYQVYLQKK